MAKIPVAGGNGLRGHDIRGEAAAPPDHEALPIRIAGETSGHAGRETGNAPPMRAQHMDARIEGAGFIPLTTAMCCASVGGVVVSFPLTIQTS